MDVITSAWLTSGETAEAVGSTPYTTHGWRPISVKIQPQELAISGKPMVHSDSRQYHALSLSLSSRSLVSASRGTSSGPVRSRSEIHSFLRVSQSPATPSAVDAIPKPIIQRNPQ